MKTFVNTDDISFWSSRKLRPSFNIPCLSNFALRLILAWRLATPSSKIFASACSKENNKGIAGVFGVCDRFFENL